MTRDPGLTRDPTALLVIRVVVERGSLLRLRAYIRQTSNVSRGFERFSTVTNVEAAITIVRDWLDNALDAGTNDDGLPAPGEHPLHHPDVEGLPVTAP